MKAVHVVVPATIDDPAHPSGGNVYDREVCRALPGCGWTVTEHRVTTALLETLGGISDRAVVMVDGLLGCHEADALRAEADRLRLVLLVHMPAGLERERDAKQEIAAEASALSAAAAVVATSDWTRSALIARHGRAAEHIRVAKPGVELAPHAQGTACGAQLLYVGAVVRHKGLDVLARALCYVADLAWDCVCVGSLDREPGYVTQVQQELARGGVGQRVRFVGAVGRDVVGKYFAAADVLLLPSRVEAYGMVVTEALARGLPVLAAQTGGVPEAIGVSPDGSRPGLLIASDDVPAWTAAVRRWLSDAQLRRALRESATARRESLPSWAMTARQVSDVLAEVAAA